MDLTPYAGKEILVRFEMITDDAVNMPGLLIDKIAIPEIGYTDNVEERRGRLGGGRLGARRTTASRSVGWCSSWRWATPRSRCSGWRSAPMAAANCTVATWVT